ncbi:hypothetical protein PL373_06085 [Tenacibaculum maritimum]|nr:hypothetical protein [Tenacibaculum maritimum]MDB0600720.1 hypothetical protein [Tenacibaculum maritimum]MDB0612703.1 hypothetical protein [Tenacibaculum maritimum]
MKKIEQITEKQLEEYKAAPNDAPKGCFLVKHKKGGFSAFKNLIGSEHSFTQWNFLKTAQSWLKTD